MSRNWFYQNKAASILSYNIESWSTYSHITSFVLRMFECAAHAVERSPAQLHLAVADLGAPIVIRELLPVAQFRVVQR